MLTRLRQIGVAIATWWSEMKGEVSSYRAFFIVVAALVAAIVAGVVLGGMVFANIFGKGVEKPEEAGAPLAVAFASAVLLTVSVVDYVRMRGGGDAINVAVPPAWKSWLPGVVAVIVGGLIGSTVFK